MRHNAIAVLQASLLLIACGLELGWPSACEAAQARQPTAPATNPLWREPKTRNYLPDMTWPEVQALLARTDMVIIPVGAVEQHGPQGPIGTDFYNGVEQAKLIAQRTDILVAPILMPGNSPYHMGFRARSRSPPRRSSASTSRRCRACSATASVASCC